MAFTRGRDFLGSIFMIYRFYRTPKFHVLGIEQSTGKVRRNANATMDVRSS